MKNRELKWALLLFFFTGAAGTAAAFCFSRPAGWITLATALAMDGLFFAFTLWRYRELRRLSDSLAELYSKKKLLDLRDNREGELSILKNDLYKMARTLIQQSELLQKEKTYLADSLSDISHQLKTPLTSLLMMNDLMEEEPLPAEKRKEFLEHSRHQLERIQWLISALLKLSKIDANAIEFKCEPICLRELLRQTAAPLAIPMELKEQRLELSCPSSLFWNGDAHWTGEAISNVLKNCVEHTPPGGVIRIRCEDNPLHTLLTIEDSGEGIDPEDLPHLFERFYRGKNAAPDSIGIGLAMSKSILQNQNASIEAQSVPGQGARFRIRLLKQVV